MSSYVIPVFPAASRVPPRDALAARLAELTGRFAELSSELAAISSAVASVSGKADKAPPAAAGNLASLDASGNLSDSGATPASIKAAAVAEVVANAPGTMDTLKEIADILGSSQQTGTVLERILGLETGKVDKNGTAVVAGIDASATGDGAVAIGPVRATGQGAGASAEGNTSVALGYWSRATAFGAVQVGFGVNSTQNSFQFRGANLFVESGGTVGLGAGFPPATTSAPGAMSAADKAKLDGVAAGATAVSVDATLSTQGAAADAKAVGDALRGGFTEWVCEEISSGWTFVKCEWGIDQSTGSLGWLVDVRGGSDAPAVRTLVEGSRSSLSLTYDGQLFSVKLTRHLITPTKTSQLTNDGDGTHAFVKTNDTRLSDARTPTAHTHAMADVTGLNAELAQKANASDLPYRLVEPGKWEFSDGEAHGISGPNEYNGTWYYTSGVYVSNVFNSESEAVTALTLTFTDPSEQSDTFTATRASLPGHLLDRAVNAVSVTGATTLTLPALVNAGKSRDLLVRLTVSADAAVTFSAPSGETVTWDDAGSPTATYEAGTHLLRFTEVGLDNGSYIFHFTDLGTGGSIDPAVLNGKLEATSAAPAFDPTKTYSVGEYVTYEGVLYECSTAVTTAGAWTGSTNWTATNMTTPDATLDLMADGRLRLVSADGDVLWMQGYGLASASSVTLSCDKVNFHAFAAGTVTQAFDMPSAPSGKVGDFVLDVDNTANASASATATLTGAGTAFDVFTPKGVNLSTDILTFAGGEQCELYFTMTAFGTAAKPAWKVVKQIVEKQEFGS